MRSSLAGVQPDCSLTIDYALKLFPGDFAAGTICDILFRRQRPPNQMVTTTSAPPSGASSMRTRQPWA